MPSVNIHASVNIGIDCVFLILVALLLQIGEYLAELWARLIMNVERQIFVLVEKFFKGENNANGC